MTNQVFTGTPTSRRQIIPCPTTVKAGDAVLIGRLAAVALDSYQANEGGTSFLFGGSFALSVVAQHGSPLVSGAIGPGDLLYADGGVLDVATNVTTGFTINADSVNGVFFGYLDPQQPKILSGVTNTAAIVLLSHGM